MDYNLTKKEIIIQEKKERDISFQPDSAWHEMINMIEQEREKLIQASLSIHRFAETGNQEFKSPQLFSKYA